MEVGNQAFFPFGLQFSESTVTNPSTPPCKANMTRLTDTGIQTITSPHELRDNQDSLRPDSVRHDSRQTGVSELNRTRPLIFPATGLFEDWNQFANPEQLKKPSRTKPEKKALSEPTHLIEHFNTLQNDLCTCVGKYLLKPT